MLLEAKSNVKVFLKWLLSTVKKGKKSGRRPYFRPHHGSPSGLLKSCLLAPSRGTTMKQHCCHSSCPFSFLFSIIVSYHTHKIPDFWKRNAFERFYFKRNIAYNGRRRRGRLRPTKYSCCGNGDCHDAFNISQIGDLV
jgi:hypothetical protein